MTIFLISDTHFNHTNILKFLKPDGTPIRPGYDGITEMNELLIARWNSLVRKQDHVYHLGDVGFGSSTSIANHVRRLNGIKRLVRGNHDKCTTSQYVRMGFQEIHGLHLLSDVWVSHAPIHPSSMGKALGNAHGHIHEKPSPLGPYVNLCVEINHGYPQSLEEVRAGLVNKRLTEQATREIPLDTDERMAPEDSHAVQEDGR